MSTGHTTSKGEKTVAVEDVKKIKGKEYVTAKEFAARMNTTIMTITRYLKSGKIAYTDKIPGKTRYFDWTQQKKLFLAAKEKAKKITKAKARPIPKDVYMDFHLVEPSAPSVNTPEVKEPTVEDVMSGRTSLDSIRALIDPEKELDCWVTDIKTDEKVFSWEVCEKKYRAIILSMKARQQAGELIEKKEIAPALDAFGTVMSAALNTSKFKIKPLIVAWAESHGATIKPEDEIYLMEKIIDPEFAMMTDDLRSEVEKESKAFTGENQEGESDVELDS